MKPLFVSGIGTGIGKTVMAAILTEALRADYWKPVQAGTDTDSLRVKSLISNGQSRIHPETYLLQLPASPHIAAKKENLRVSMDRILEEYGKMDPSRTLVVEGAGGLFVPLNEKEFVIDLIRALDARLILVSRNYLGSINHSLMTAKLSRAYGLDIAGWIFNDQFMNYEQEIVGWSGYPSLFSVPLLPSVSRESVLETAQRVSPSVRHLQAAEPGHPVE